MTLFESFLIALPAFAGNMAPVVAMKYKILETWAIPVENLIPNGAGMLGVHKTWRGVIVAVLGGGIIGALLSYAGLTGDMLGSALYGMYAGLLAIVGDLIESGIKRRLGIASGKPFIPWDQIDYMILFLVGTHALFTWSVSAIVFLLAVAFFGNLFTNYAAFNLGIKSTPW